MKIIKNQEGLAGLLLVSLIIILVSVLSSVALINQARYDFFNVQNNFDMIQEELFLRTEAGRTTMAMEANKNAPLPKRKIYIFNGSWDIKYEIISKKETTTISNFMGWATAQVISLTSKIKANYGKYQSQGSKSPITRLSEKL